MRTGAQASQQRPPTSQQSFSQGMSSQHGMFSQASYLRSQLSQGIISQFSQNPLDDTPTTDLVNHLERYNSQERENPTKKSCLAAISHQREENQVAISRAPSNLVPKWNPATVRVNNCQKNEELDRRLGIIETSLNKFGIILDSIQNDVIQVNRGTKQVSAEMEGMRQKLIVVETSLQLLIKGQAENKFSFDGSLRSISKQLSEDRYRDKLQHIFLVLSTLPDQLKASLQDLLVELQRNFTKRTQAVATSQKINHKSPSISVLPVKVHKRKHGTLQRKPEPIKYRLVVLQVTVDPKVETEGWKSVRVETTSKREATKEEQKHMSFSLVKQERNCRLMIDSDEDIDGGFSCLIDGNTGIDTDVTDEAVKDKKIPEKSQEAKEKIL